MGKRGRPAHPDILTPREWEVLALLRQQLSNEEIAERLGISLAGAKYHVSEILGKLGVSSREEAARWQPTERPWWAAAFAPLPFWRRLGWLPQAVAAGAFVAAAAGIGLMIWGLVRTSGENSSAVAPTATAGFVAGAPTATPLEPTPGVPIGETRVLATGTAGGMDWSPDGQSIAYVLDGRVYRADAPDFSPQLLAEGPGYEPLWSPDGTQIAFHGRHAGRFGDPNDSSWSIWLINSDGSGLRDLLPGAAADLALRGPKLGQWLDDHTLVFYDGCGTACRQPHLLDTLTSKVTRGVRVPGITTGLVGVGILGTAYYWSPDKRWIAAVYAEKTNPIALYDRENQNLVQLPGPPAGFNQFQGLWQLFDSWAPDSTRFLYEQLNPNSTAESPLPPSLHIYDIATDEDRTLVEAGSNGSWSTDGKLVAYIAEATAARPCGESGAETACVALIDVASGDELYRVPGPGSFGLSGGGLTFLSDDRLLYPGYKARELRLASQGESVVLANVNGMREFKVSPDGRYVVTSEPGVSGRIILVAIPPP